MSRPVTMTRRRRKAAMVSLTSSASASAETTPMVSTSWRCRPARRRRRGRGALRGLKPSAHIVNNRWIGAGRNGPAASHHAWRRRRCCGRRSCRPDGPIRKMPHGFGKIDRRGMHPCRQHPRQRLVDAANGKIRRLAQQGLDQSFGQAMMLECRRQRGPQADAWPGKARSCAVCRTNAGMSGLPSHLLNLTQSAQAHRGVNFVLAHHHGLRPEALDDRAHEGTDLRAGQQHRHFILGGWLRRNARAPSG